MTAVNGVDALAQPDRDPFAFDSPRALTPLDTRLRTGRKSSEGYMENGVHYCQVIGLYKVWIDGFVVAGSNDPAEATMIFRARLRRQNLVGFKPSERWMVNAYGD